MQRVKWILYFCEKYITKVFLICAFLCGSLCLVLLIFALALGNSNPEEILIFLYMGGAAFIIFSLFVIPFVYRIIKEEKYTNRVFLPSNVKKFEDMLYFSDDWVIICGKTVINKINIEKIATGTCHSRGYTFFCVAFYTKNHEKPIKFTICINGYIDKEYFKLRDRFKEFVEGFDCPYEENQVFD